jgi:hypothetical protein
LSCRCGYLELLPLLPPLLLLLLVLPLQVLPLLPWLASRVWPLLLLLFHHLLLKVAMVGVVEEVQFNPVLLLQLLCILHLS